MRQLLFRLPGLFLLFGLIIQSACSQAAVSLPDAAFDEPKAKTGTTESIVLAGGCFWGMQLVFQHVKGVIRTTAGYAGGTAATAHYETVSTGQTGHAESVSIAYDASQITLGQILKIYFAVAHDPTELNRQGPDSGTQYRSAIFAATPLQQKIAGAYIAQLSAAHSFTRPIVTAVTPLDGFYPAEAYHQDYAAHHPDNPYIRINDAPKVAALKQSLPQFYRADVAG